MPDIPTYTFNHKELVALMIRDAGIHEGQWMLQISLGFSAGNIGQSEDNVSPAAIAVIQEIGITRAKADSPPALVVDASEANPA